MGLLQTRRVVGFTQLMLIPHDMVLFPARSHDLWLKLAESKPSAKPSKFNRRAKQLVDQYAQQTLEVRPGVCLVVDQAGGQMSKESFFSQAGHRLLEVPKKYV